MRKIRWDFPILGSGSTEGLNKASLKMFDASGSMNSLAREICQNSLDAKDESLPENVPVKVKFKLSLLDTKSHKIFSDFKNIISGAKNYWKSSSYDTKEIMNFLDTADRYLKLDKIPVLTMSDFNTKGLNSPASDTPDNPSRFNALVNAEGISLKKDKDSSGSYGIGKNAPFVYSGLNMVVYSTLAKEGNWKGVEGVCHFVTTVRNHPTDPTRTLKTRSTGKYLNIEDEYDEGCPILPTDNCDLFSVFERTTPGTDVAIIGFKAEEYKRDDDGSGWETLLTAAVIKNFIMAIFTGKLEVSIESPSVRTIVINKDTLHDLLYDRFKDKCELDSTKPDSLKLTKQIYETITQEKPVLKKIAEDDDLSIYMHKDEAYEGASFRFRNGMLIEQKKASPGYCIVASVNRIGARELTTTLKFAEPTTHDSWSITNIRDDDEHKELRQKADKYIKRIQRVVRELLKKAEEVEIAEHTDAGVGEYLPDVSKSSDGNGADELKTDLKINKIESNDGEVIYTRSTESASSSVGGKTDKKGGKAGEKKRKKRKQKKAIPVVTPGEGNTKGVSPGKGKVRVPVLDSSDKRIFFKNNGSYHMFIDSPDIYNKVYVSFYAYRDDERRDLLEVSSAEDQKGGKLPVSKGILGPIYLDKGPNGFDIKFVGNEVLAVIPEFRKER